MRWLYLFSAIVLVGLAAGCGTAKLPVQPSSQATVVPAGIFYFYSDTCAHCAAVEQYIAENKIRQKLYFISRNVAADQANSGLFVAVGQRCGIAENKLAVPLLYDGQRCYVGQDNVISYFTNLP